MLCRGRALGSILIWHLVIKQNPHVQHTSMHLVMQLKDFFWLPVCVYAQRLHDLFSHYASPVASPSDRASESNQCINQLRLRLDVDKL